MLYIPNLIAFFMYISIVRCFGVQSIVIRPKKDIHATNEIWYNYQMEVILTFVYPLILLQNISCEIKEKVCSTLK